MNRTSSQTVNRLKRSRQYSCEPVILLWVILLACLAILISLISMAFRGPRSQVIVRDNIISKQGPRRNDVRKKHPIQPFENSKGKESKLVDLENMEFASAQIKAVTLSYFSTCSPEDFATFETRFDIPSRINDVPRSLTLEESSSRVFLSGIRTKIACGLGHGMAITNYEFYMAFVYKLTYLHRTALYSQLLSSEDEMAVEDFFGIYHDEVNRDVFLKHCQLDVKSKSKKWGNFGKNCPICVDVKKGWKNTMLQHLINFPQEAWYVCSRDNEWTSKGCPLILEQILNDTKSYKNVGYQAPESLCGHTANSDFSLTWKWFYHHYWKSHGNLANWSLKEYNQINKRVVNLNDKRIQIAVHSRRGDFLLLRKKRTLIADSVYEQVVGEVIEKIGPTKRYDIHIFSEGKVDSTENPHDVRLQTCKYLTEESEVRDVESWVSSLSTKLQTNFIEMDVAVDFTIHYHICESVFKSLHIMIASDIFVGSFSGLSKNVVKSLSRGITILPDDGLWGVRGITYDTIEGKIDGDRFLQLWAEYEAEFKINCVEFW